MPRTGERGGPQTRARIAQVASGMFHERGFDAVTVAEIAREAGVSSVTVFKHFPRKEDLFLDRAEDAAALLRSAVRDRRSGLDVLDALQRTTDRLVADRHPLSGLAELSVPFLRTVADSPVLVARAREIAAELEWTLTAELSQDPGFTADAALFAALFVSGYAAVLVETARQRLAGASPDAAEPDHRARLARLFEALRHGFGATA